MTDEHRAVTTSVENPAERRLNPLTGDWVLVSSGRDNRPWDGDVEPTSNNFLPNYDPDCALCPGNLRANGTNNPSYLGPYFFENDFPALPRYCSNQPIQEIMDPLRQSKLECGVCKVFCFSEQHDLSLSRMTNGQIENVLLSLRTEIELLAKSPQVQHIQVFENRGGAMGCSNPHPHGQIWAQSTIPSIVAREIDNQARYFNANQRLLLLDYVEAEERDGTRVLFRNDGFTVVVPYWAAWPFETMIIPNKSMKTLLDLTGSAVEYLADVLRRVTTCYDNLFNTSFPYSMGIHQAPFDGVEHSEFQLHFHFYPPLLRSAKVRKFMVGYEMMAEAQRDITPEKAAGILKALPRIHYRGDQRAMRDSDVR